MGDLNRRKILSALNKQRNRLRKKGAAPTEISAYFGYPEDKPFSKIDDDYRLKAFYDEYKNKPIVKVDNGAILPEKYIRYHDYWFKNGSTPRKTSYKSAMESNFMSAKDKKDLQRRKREFDLLTKQRYIDAVYIAGGSKRVANGIKRMSTDNFWKFVKESGGLLSYEVFVVTDGEGNLISDDIQKSVDKNRIESLEELYDKFIKKRRS